LWQKGTVKMKLAEAAVQTFKHKTRGEKMQKNWIKKISKERALTCQTNGGMAPLG
jgi:hypothetical protein